MRKFSPQPKMIWWVTLTNANVSSIASAIATSGGIITVNIGASVTVSDVSWNLSLII